MKRETSPLDDIASDWSRFANANVRREVRAALDSLPVAIAEVRRVENLAAPTPMVAPLARVVQLMTRALEGTGCRTGCPGVLGDLASSLQTSVRRATSGLLAASGVLVEATAPREMIAVHDTLPVTISVYNQGATPVTLEGASVWTIDSFGPAPSGTSAVIAPDSSGRITLPLTPGSASVPWWLALGKRGDVFMVPGSGSIVAENIALGEDRVADTHVSARLRIAGVPVAVDAGPVVYRFADPARGEQRRPVAAVPGVNVLFDSEVEYARAGVPFERTYNVRLHNASAAARGVVVSLTVPAGLKLDSLVRRAALEPFSDAVLAFHVRGTLPAGRHLVSALATSGDDKFISGYVPIRYDHIKPLRFYRAASVEIEAVNAALPAKTSIAYIRGVGDNVATMLGQLGMKVTLVTPEELADADLTKFGAVVVGPRAFAASPALVTNARRLQEFARSGGTVVLQYGQSEIQTPGILPYPVSLKQPAERVTDETAPVRVLASGSTLLSKPNRIAPSDFNDWVQERSTYMPTTADPHYQRLLEINDPGEPANQNALLVAPVGKGAYVYATLALFRQLPSGVPGAARLFLNLIAADGKSPAATVP